MKILLDECVPRPIRPHIKGHDVQTIRQNGWNGLKNGALLKTMTAAGFEVLLTVDQNIAYQQNVAQLPIAIIIMIAQSNRLESLEPLIPDVLESLKAALPGNLYRVGEK
jgi:hypothetical protein